MPVVIGEPVELATEIGVNSSVVSINNSELMTSLSIRKYVGLSIEHRSGGHRINVK